MSWQGGYVADVAYTSGVYLEMAPAHLAVCALLGGVSPPDPTRPYRYLELGCGTGMGVALLAAANPHAEFVGVDFNPTHVLFAERLIEAAGLANVRVVEASFADLATASDDTFGRFDYAVAHGVWTWVGPAARQELVAALECTVKPGGLVYLGYNNMAGWAGSLSLQRLIRDHAARVPGDSLTKIRAAVRFALDLRNVGSRGVDFTRLELQLKGATEDPDKAPVGLYAYLAHEYLNEHWAPVFPADLAADLAGAKLAYVASADPFAAIPEVALSEGQRRAAALYPDVAGSQVLADLLAPTSFRQDIFMRGAAPLTPPRREAALRAVELAAAAPLGEEALAVDVPSGRLELDGVAYRPVFARLQEGPAPVGELLARVEAAGRRMSAVELLAVLTGSGLAVPIGRAAPTRDAEAERTRVRRYNVAMVETLRDQAGLRLALASPLTGSGLRAGMGECLAYLAAVGPPGTHPDLDTPALQALAAANADLWASLQVL